MHLTLSQIAGVAVFVSALQYGQAFGQTPNILELRDAAKDAFESTSKAFETIEKDQKKGKSAGSKKGATASKSTKTPARQSNSSKGSTAKDESSGGTMFSKIAGRAARAETSGPSSSQLAAEEQEKKFLSFLGASSDTIYRVALSIVGIAFAILVGLRIKERVKDVTTGRTSLSRSRIIRR